MSRSQKQRKSATKKAQAARARAARHLPKHTPTPGAPTASPSPSSETLAREATPTDSANSTPNLDNDECGWDGGVHHDTSDAESSDDEYSPSHESDWDDESDGELEELDDDNAIVVSLQKELSRELEQLSLLTAWEALAEKAHTATKGDWEVAEKCLKSRGTYTGKSARSKRRDVKNAENKEKEDAVSRTRYVHSPYNLVINAKR